MREFIIQGSPLAQVDVVMLWMSKNNLGCRGSEGLGLFSSSLVGNGLWKSFSLVLVIEDKKSYGLL